MENRRLKETRTVSVTFTNPLGMNVTVKKKLTEPEIKKILSEGKVSIDKISN